jgi:hypothetical protein
MRYFIILGSFYLVALCYLFLNGAWYEKAYLEIGGTVSSLPSGFNIQWDSGHGFNNYETYRVRFSPHHKAPSGGHVVKLSYLGKKNGASLTDKVTVNRIIIDEGSDYQVKVGNHTKSLSQINNITLDRDTPDIFIQASAKHYIGVELLTNNHSGIIGVTLNDHFLEQDLYIANVEAKSRLLDFWLLQQGHFLVNIDLPRYKTRTFAITPSSSTAVSINSVRLFTKKHLEPIPLLFKRESGGIFLAGLSENYKRYFLPNHFAGQLVNAALLTWLFSILVRFILSGNKLSTVFFRHTALWSFTFGAWVFYLVWLIVFWPGVMSVDSLKIWRAAQLPEVLINDHPILNVYLYSLLYQIWNHPAVVPIFHVSLTGVLIGFVFAWLYRANVSLRLLLPCYIFMVLSIPIGLYNLMLWKDVPFAILVVFWAIITAVLYQKQRCGTLKLTSEQIIALLLLLIALGLVRHNGLVYLIAIPLLFLVTGIVCIKRKIVLAVFGIAVVCCGVVMVSFKTGILEDRGFLALQLKAYSERLFSKTITDILLTTWDNYWNSLNINQTDSKWDLFHYYLQDRYAYGFLEHAGWNDVYRYIPRPEGLLSGFHDTAMRLYWASYEKPLVYVSWNPVWGLALFLLSLLLYKKLPLSALFSAIIVIQICTLAFLDIMNWRYYYFACVASYLIIPMIMLDMHSQKVQSSAA